MKISRYFLIPAVSALLFTACDDDTSLIGSSLSRGEVTIVLDSLKYHLQSEVLERDNFDSRSTTTLLGRISVPVYGDLRCSFVSQLLPATTTGIPDSIGVERMDSMRMIASVPRGAFTGDSIAPQQLKVYSLTKPLPAYIDNKFDPDGYFDKENPLGCQTYSMNELSSNDSIFAKRSVINIPVTLPAKMARETFNAYKSDPSLFEWPANFSKKYPGVYVESGFGRGCISNIAALNFYIYYHHLETRTFIEGDVSVNKEVVVKDSVSVFTTGPEVTTANIISYEIGAKLKGMKGDGKSLVTTPGGYVTRIKFPADEIIKEYNDRDHNMGIVSNLSFSLPASQIENDLDIQVPPFMALIKTSELDSFFNANKLPDDKTSFWAAYNSTTGQYTFKSMRQYIVDLMKNDMPPTDDDMDFTLIPVNILTESETNSYTGAVTTYVTRCAPYMLKPTMALLHTDRAVICFTYSMQTIK